MPSESNFSPFQVKELKRRGISEDLAATAGVRPVQEADDLPQGCPDYWTTENGYLPGLLYLWESPSGSRVWQLKPDVPVVPDRGGRPKKYLFPADTAPILNLPLGARDTPDDVAGVLIVEGTNQGIAAAHYAPADWIVLGIAGCQSWMSEGIPDRDLKVARGRTVVIALDADAEHNRAVYDAGVSLAVALRAEQAIDVRFLRVPGGGKSGLDDVLGARDEEDRAPYLENLIGLALTSPKKDKTGQPAPSKPPRNAVSVESDPDSIWESDGRLKVETIARQMMRERPAALTREGTIAAYVGGVYRPERLDFIAAAEPLLGDRYSTGQRANIEEWTTLHLRNQGWFLPDQVGEPMVNVRNGMLDLRDGELYEHDPAYLSSVQLPVTYDPDAVCPRYEAWMRDVLPDQWEDLEEAMGLMLDPTRTPDKSIFLFGPSHSGKSTVLRILAAIAGPENRSAESLHGFANDPFAAAQVYGKILNVCGDLSAADVQDTSLFKRMTGDDPVSGNRKYGKKFNFRSRALFAFSANEIPGVSDSSRAWINRIRPYRFTVTFEGREDPSIEEGMLEELPGILNRLVAAYRRRRDRGAWLEVPIGTADEFRRGSDKVRRWFDERAEIIETDTVVTPGSETITNLYRAYQVWCRDEGADAMQKLSFTRRLFGFDDVKECRNEKRARSYNVRIRPKEDWGLRDEPDKTDSPHVAKLETDISGQEAKLEGEVAKVAKVSNKRATCDEGVPQETDGRHSYTGTPLRARTATITTTASDLHKRGGEQPSGNLHRGKTDSYAIDDGEDWNPFA